MLQQINAGQEAEIQKCRDYIGRLMDITAMLGKQGLPFRGHDKTNSNHNKEIFLECLELLKKYDPFLKSYDPPGSAK